MKDRVDKSISFQKIWNYIISITNDPEFKTRVKKIRTKYNIPTDGIIKTLSIKVGDKIESMDSKINTEISKLTKEYGLGAMWSLVFKNYLIYNRLDLQVAGTPFHLEDLGWLFDLNFPTKKQHKDFVFSYFKEKSKYHPIALLLHPYASQREAVDYIKTIFKSEIEPIQNQYKKASLKIGKIKKENEIVRIKDAFVYDNKDLDRTILVRLYSDTFGEILDYSYISKILKRERKRRGI